MSTDTFSGDGAMSLNNKRGLKSVRVRVGGEGVRKCLFDPSSFLGRDSILSH